MIIESVITKRKMVVTKNKRRHNSFKMGKKLSAFNVFKFRAKFCLNSRYKIFPCYSVIVLRKQPNCRRKVARFMYVDRPSFPSILKMFVTWKLFKKLMKKRFVFLVDNNY
jgi:hypothetical protein